MTFEEDEREAAQEAERQQRAAMREQLRQQALRQRTELAMRAMPASNPAFQIAGPAQQFSHLQGMAGQVMGAVAKENDRRVEVAQAQWDRQHELDMLLARLQAEDEKDRRDHGYKAMALNAYNRR